MKKHIITFFFEQCLVKNSYGHIKTSLTVDKNNIGCFLGEKYESCVDLLKKWLLEQPWNDACSYYVRHSKNLDAIRSSLKTENMNFEYIDESPRQLVYIIERPIK